MVEVTQEDRDAAAELLTECLGLHWNSAARIAPEHLARHRIAAENAALERAVKVAIEALTEAREALHFHYTEAREALPFYYVEWGGEPEDAVQLQLARSKCDEAIRALKGPSNAD